MLRVSAVERLVGVGQFLPVTLLDRHGLLHTDKRDQAVCSINERSGDVQDINFASETLCEKSCRSAQSTPDIYKMLPGLDGQSIRQRDGGRNSTCVKMVDRRQLFYRHGFWVYAGGLHGLNDTRVNVARSPMIRN